MPEGTVRSVKPPQALLTSMWLWSSASFSAFFQRIHVSEEQLEKFLVINCRTPSYPEQRFPGEWGGCRGGPPGRLPVCLVSPWGGSEMPGGL